MKVCPRCGYKDHDYWRHSRFDYNADYCTFEEFREINPELAEKLKGMKNFQPVEDEHYYYYRRGTGGNFVYRVWKPEFKVPRERVRHTLSPSKRLKTLDTWVGT